MTLLVTAIVATARAADPTAQELHFLYELNRVRHDPAAWAAGYNLGAETGGDGQPATLTNVAPRPPLAWNPQLTDSARFKAQEIAANDYSGHQSTIGPDFYWPNELTRVFGYPLAPFVSNPAGGYSLLVGEGSYSVACSGGGFSGPAAAWVAMAGTNHTLDCISGQPSAWLDFAPAPAPESAAAAAGLVAVVALSLARRRSRTRRLGSTCHRAQALTSFELQRLVQQLLHRFRHAAQSVLAQQLRHTLDRGRLLFVVGPVCKILAVCRYPQRERAWPATSTLRRSAAAFTEETLHYQLQLMIHTTASASAA
jgi:hypothetical protein